MVVWDALILRVSSSSHKQEVLLFCVFNWQKNKNLAPKGRKFVFGWLFFLSNISYCIACLLPLKWCNISKEKFVSWKTCRIFSVNFQRAYSVTNKKADWRMDCRPTAMCDQPGDQHEEETSIIQSIKWHQTRDSSRIKKIVDQTEIFSLFVLIFQNNSFFKLHSGERRVEGMQQRAIGHTRTWPLWPCSIWSPVHPLS